MAARTKLALAAPAVTKDAAVERSSESAHLDQCMERFLEGDRCAFEEIFRRLAPRLLRSLRLASGDAQLADDLVQITFLKVVRARESYRRGMSVEAWIWAIAKNAHLDEQRRRSRTREMIAALPVSPSMGGAFAPPVEQRSDVEQLGLALEQLPEPQREALLLLKVYDLSAGEAAIAAGTTVGAVKMRAQRAFETLRKVLSRKPER